MNEKQIQLFSQNLATISDGELQKLNNDLVALCFVALDCGVHPDYIIPMYKLWEPLSEALCPKDTN